MNTSTTKAHNLQSQNEVSLQVSIYCEIYSEEDLDQGASGERTVEIEREVMDASALAKCALKFGITQPSILMPVSGCVGLAATVWFVSSYPREDRDFFEKGIKKYYSIHVHEIDGREPGADDYLRIAALLNIRLGEAPRAAAGMKG